MVFLFVASYASSSFLVKVDYFIVCVTSLETRLLDGIDDNFETGGFYFPNAKLDGSFCDVFNVVCFLNSASIGGLVYFTS